MMSYGSFKMAAIVGIKYSPLPLTYVVILKTPCQHVMYDDLYMWLFHKPKKWYVHCASLLPS